MQSFETFCKGLELVEQEVREEYIAEQYEELVEKLITFGGKAYPKFGNVIIMAGGAGSGKGFVKDNLVGAEGFTFDVDQLKTLASKTPIIAKRVKEEMGIDLADLAANLKDPKNVSKLHEIIGKALDLDNRKLEALYTSILSADPSRKPNIIFDVTLKDLRKLEKLTTKAADLGYDKKNIHIVWVVNDIEVALDQNAKRSRTVDADILINTHRGAAATMSDIINMGKRLNKYMDGDIVFAFNKVGVDSQLAKGTQYGPNPQVGGRAMGPTKSGRKIGMSGKTKGGSYIVDANYFYVKRQGKLPLSKNEISRDLKNKIATYVPAGVNWAD